MISFDGWWWSADIDEVATQAYAPRGSGSMPTFQTINTRGGAEVTYPRLERSGWARVLGSVRGAGTHLRGRSASELVEVLGEVGERFLNDDQLLTESVGAVSATSGLSIPAAEWVVRSMAEGWTREALDQLLRSEFPEPRVLDEWVDEGSRRVMVTGPNLLVHVGSGSVPGVTATSMLRGLLVKAPSLVKPGLGDVALAVLVARTIDEIDEELGKAIAVVYWPGGEGLDPHVLDHTDRVVVYGSHDTISAVRRATPPHIPLVEHGPRLGVSVVHAGVDLDLAAEMALAVSAFDQRGCVSPHIAFWLGDVSSALRWAEELAFELGRTADRYPIGDLPLEAMTAIHQARGALAVRQAAGEPVHLITRPDELWTVVVTEDANQFEPVGGRFLWIVPVADPEGLKAQAKALAPHLQSVGLGGFEGHDGRRTEVIDVLMGLGATRFAGISEIPFPPSDWLHDGSRPLGELARWVERTD